MKLPRQQRGATMWQTCLYIFVFLTVVTTALKLGPLYIQDQNIGSALNALNESMSGDVTNEAIKDRLSKTFQVSMIDDKYLSDLEVDRTGVTPVLKMDYEVRTPFVGNVEVILHFSHAVKLTSVR
jgi:hypothetical protein